MPEVALNLPLLTGPLLFLVSFAFMLYGAFGAQVFYYWSNYQKDSSRLKSYVYMLFLMETIHTAFCLHVLYTYFVVDVNNLPSIGHIIWSTGLTVYLEVVIVSMTEGFYVYRVYHLSGKNKWITGTLATFLFCRVSFGFGTGCLTYRFDTWEGFRDSQAAVITVNCGLVLAAVVDMLCAFFLTYYLRKRQSRFRRTQHLVHTLMFYAINTGALTMVSSLAILFMFNFATNSLMFAGMVQFVSKLYANSVLALLNARNRLKEETAAGNFQSIPLSLRAGTSTGGTQTVGGVHVEIEKDSDAVNHSARTSQEVAVKQAGLEANMA